MKAVKYLARRRFNYIDILSIGSAAWMLDATDNWWLLGLVLAVGIVVSMLAERTTGEVPA